LVGISTDIALSPREFGEELQAKKISAMFVTAALFNQIAREAPAAFETVDTVIAGGEALDPKWVGAILAGRPPHRLVNGYGPTENTTFTCCKLITAVDPKSGNVPIGRPIANTQVYILDKYLKPVPVGVPGELYAGGDGVALGYWNRPELNAQKFVPNPFAQEKTGAMLYRTGDLARYLPSGEIEFLAASMNRSKSAASVSNRVKLKRRCVATQKLPIASYAFADAKRTISAS
jgi:non-ribosomal peptide synthetase component F